MQQPKVFISYSHDSEEHKRAVLSLSDSLRSRGIDCTIDQYEESPPAGWAHWSYSRVEEADFVLVICTETYHRRFRLEEESGKGEGAKWEGVIITQHLYNTLGRHNKFIPVVFEPEDERHIPLPLSGSTKYVLSRPGDDENLYRRLTGQPKVLKPPLGEREVLPPEAPQQTFPSHAAELQPDPATTVPSRPAVAAADTDAGPLITIHAGLQPPSIKEISPPVEDFVGREELVEKLLAAAEKQRRIVLYGVGGIGKTELARLLADRLSAIWPAQLYFDLRGTEPEHDRPPAAEVMFRVVRRFEPKYKRPKSNEELAGRYHSVLHKNPALLLLDNAADGRQVEPLARLPKSCILLVTSRSRIVLSGAVYEALPFISDEDASELLLKIAPRIGPDAPSIAGMCGGIPLALRLAAGALAEQVALCAREYIERLKEANERLKLLEASIQVSYNLLSAEQQRLWRVLSVFPETFDRGAASAVWNSDVKTAQDVLSAVLEPRSLVMWDSQSNRFRLHELLRLFADNCLDDEERNEVARRHASYYAEILAQRSAPTGKRLALFDAEQANIGAGFKWACARINEDVGSARLCSNYVLAGRDVLHSRLKPGDMLEWARAAKEAAQLINDLAAESHHTGFEGLARADLGNLREAIECYKRQLEIAQRINDLESVCTALLRLGSDYRLSKELTLAREFLTKCIEVASRIGDSS